MSSLNLILGSVFGLLAVLGGPVGESYVDSVFQTQLREKAKLTPGRINPDGTQEKDTMEISVIDRRENTARWARYQKGLQSIALHSLALLALGLVASRGYGPVIGCIGFGLGTLLYGCGLACGAYLDMATLNVFSSIGAMLLLAGWGGLLLAAIQWNSQPTTIQEASA